MKVMRNVKKDCNICWNRIIGKYFLNNEQIYKKYQQNELILEKELLVEYFLTETVNRLIVAYYSREERKYFQYLYLIYVQHFTN